VSFGAIEETLGQALLEEDNNEPGTEPEEEDEGSEEDGIDFRFVETEEDILATFRGGTASSGRRGGGDAPDRERLQSVLRDLIDCRQMIDRVLKEH
jgi:hypothetical protein